MALRALRFLIHIVMLVRFSILQRNRIDIIFCVHSWYAMPGYFISLLIHKPLVWDVHSGLVRYSLRPPSVFDRIQMFLDKACGRLPARAIVRSEQDKQIFINEGKRENDILVLPECADFELIEGLLNSGACESIERRSPLLGDFKEVVFFMGTRLYEPNRRAAYWINDVLVPRLSRVVPGLGAIIASDGPIPVPLTDSVRFVGYVPNVFALALQCDLAVIPIWEGSGMLDKVIDLMALGKPCVVTDFVTKGVPQLVDGQNAMVANTEQEFLEKTATILQDKELALSVGQRALNTTKQFYDWNIHRGRLVSFVDGSREN